MKLHVWHLVTVVCLLAGEPLFSQDVKLPVPIPDGTRVAPVKMGDSDTPVTLKPAEQVAFLFLYSVWNLEQRAADKDMGIGRLCTLGELVKGVKTADGQTFGLKVTPTKDTNYTYDFMIVGQHVVMRAVPRTKGIGALAMVASGSIGGNTMYYNPDGPDLAKAQKLTEMGFSGDGFSR